MDLPRSLQRLLVEQSQVVLTRDAECEVGRGAVRHAIATGRWQHVGHGLVVTHSGSLTQAQLLWVAVLGAPRGSALAGTTALVAAGMTGLPLTPVHIAIPHSARRPVLDGVRVHRSTLLGDEQVQPHSRPRRLRVERSVLDAVAWAPTARAAYAIPIASVQQGVSTGQRLQRVAAERGRFHRAALLREAVEDILAGAQSVPEAGFVRLCRQAGTPRPSRQALVRRRNGRYYLDADWPEHGVSAEVDGVQHLAVAQWLDDVRRATWLTARGRRVLRFTSYDVRHRPDIVIDALRAAFTAAQAA